MHRIHRIAILALLALAAASCSKNEPGQGAGAPADSAAQAAAYPG